LYSNENSPAIYGWGIRQTNHQVPEGRKKSPAVPDGTRNRQGDNNPAINGWAIFKPARRNDRAQRELKFEAWRFSGAWMLVLYFRHHESAAVRPV
jgi:hypothetical protein